MKKVAGTMYKQRQIVLVPFPYSDLSATKRRPVLGISNDDYNNRFDDLVVCAITSTMRVDGYSLALTNDDLEIGLLPESSVVKAHKLFTIHTSRVLRIFSQVRGEYFEKVRSMLNQLTEQK